MCGIAGYVTYQKNNTNNDKYIYDMTNALTHRGPDSQGTWMDQDLGIALGHRRLSIVDLSPEGHQPMKSRNERYVIVFNGEIYNHESIRKDLQLKDDIINFCGHSDTEVMLSAFEVWGVKKSVEKFVGMFAFALWDRKERKLYLVRDRAGEKPLYYGWIGKTFVFGSELKAICKYPLFKKEIDRDALALYVRHNYIPAPYTIYKNIKKLEPGYILCLDYNSRAEEVTAYWSIKDVVEYGIENPFDCSEQEIVGQLDEVLRSAVKQQMTSSDVPVGAFLSGGIDSSTIVALMQAQSEQPIKTFSIGFNEEKYNEAVHAKKVAAHLGTSHTELYITPQQALDVVPLLPTLYDEPFSDSSQIPTYLVSKLAKQHVTVSLSGDGGDELFGGYSRYFMAQNLWNKINKIPYPIRQVGSSLILNNSVHMWERILKITGSSKLLKSMNGRRLHNAAHLLKQDNIELFYQSFVTHWKNNDFVIGSTKGLNNKYIHDTHRVNNGSEIEKMMFYDTLTYLPDDILVKVDRASMGVSLESRVPLLDFRVIEFASKIPLSMKIKGNVGKWILRQVLYNYVPKNLIERPKMGFGVPIDSWLRGPLREWGEDLLNERLLKEQGFFQYKLIRQKWEAHVNNKGDYGSYLWDILMFQAWLEKQ
jgi:asparagine synthase (glutamine-hydrolysing)